MPELDLYTQARRFVSFVSAASLLAVLAACGGGDNAATPGSPAAMTRTVTTASTGRVNATSVDPWSVCASEGGLCAFAGAQEVRYGSLAHNVVALKTGPISCTNAEFGDPDVGTAKTCWIASVPADPAWVLCASEWQTCTFSGTRTVRYGAASTFATGTFNSSVTCANTVFGDPLPMVQKSCWYQADAATPVPTGNWIPCAQENGACAFAGVHAVRYGTATQFTVATFNGGVACANSVFGDPAYGVLKSCSYAETAAAPVTPQAPTLPVGPSGQNPPIVFNMSHAVHGGDVVSLQGENFGSAPRVVLEAAPDSPLEIVNRVGTGWLAVQIPPSVTGAVSLRVSNDTGTSARLSMNAATPLHLDAMQLAPGGAFRVFGRALRWPGGTPKVTVDGLAATIDLDRSDETMLTLTAPAGLKATSASQVVVDNGNGSGPATLDRSIAVVVAGNGDPFALGVGWGSGFSAIANTTINAATDARLSDKVMCNGSHDDSGAIRAAVDLGVSLGGAVVRLPAGRCLLGYGMELKSKVVVQGAGKAATELVYSSNYPVYGVGLDLSGIGNLTLTNTGAATEGPMLKDSSRVFMQNLRIQLTTSRQMYLTGNRHFVVANSDFVQTGSISEQGPYTFNDTTGLVFEGNTTQWVNGAPTFGRIHDSYVHGNRFTRDARVQNASGTVHAFTIDFAHRLAVVGNTFDVVNGPITNKTRNDGETILTEGGGANRTENLGTVASAGATSLSDPSNNFQLDPFGTGATPENYGVAIVGGKGAGQTRRVLSGSGGTLNVDRAWDVVPDTTSHYATFVWGLEKSLIKDNVLAQNPRGIWLYQTAIRDVDVVGNRISEGGGIFLRAYQNLSAKRFMPLYNVVIANNQISNTTGQWMSYVNAVFANSDARAFGIAMIGIEMRANEIVANRPNVGSNLEDYAGTEGYMNMMRVENFSGYESSVMPRLLGTILNGNACTNCDVGVRIGTGAGGTTILNSRLVNTARPTDDWATTSTPEKSTGTVIR